MMIRLKSLFPVLFIACIAGSYTVSAAQAPAARKEHEFALVDIQRVINESKRGKQKREEFLKSVRTKTNEVDSYKKEVDQLNRTLEEKQRTLSPGQFEKARLDAENRVKELQRKAQDISEDLQSRESRMAADLAVDIKTVAADYARRKGYDLVLESSQHLIPYKNDGVDLTDAIIREYDNVATGAVPAKKK